MIIEFNIELGYKFKYYYIYNIGIGNMGDIVYVIIYNL